MSWTGPVLAALAVLYAALLGAQTYAPHGLDTAVGIALGAASIAAMSLALILSARPRWVEGLFGGLDRMYGVHKWLGIAALALYCFSHDTRARQMLLQRTHSGGVTLNDWGWHVLNHDAPFGGIGNSGMGTYHGEEGFRELSHAKTVFKRHRWFPIGLFYPPYGNLVQRLVLRVFLGKGDPSVRGAGRSKTASQH